MMKGNIIQDSHFNCQKDFNDIPHPLLQAIETGKSMNRKILKKDKVYNNKRIL